MLRHTPSKLFGNRICDVAVAFCSALGTIYFAFSDSSPVSAGLLRDMKETLLDVCPRFPQSQSPVIFHLPEETAVRIVSNFPIDLDADIYTEIGLCRLGFDEEELKKRLPRRVFEKPGR